MTRRSLLNNELYCEPIVCDFLMFYLYTICSTERRGIYSGGIMRMAMVPFKSVTQTLEEAEAIIAKQRKLFEKLIVEGTNSRKAYECSTS